MTRKTELLKPAAPATDDRAVQRCADILRRGGLVAIPTETVYGLGAHALMPEAVRSIFAAKGRPDDNPLIVHADTPEAAFALARFVPEAAGRLADRFWPGPLTIILKKSDEVPDVVTAGLDSVALRVPAHPVAAAVLAALGAPVAAPSANVSGRPSPTTAAHVLEDLDGRIDAVVDGGRTGIGLESTVVDLTSGLPRILRPGGIGKEALEAALGMPVLLYEHAGEAVAGSDAAAPSPGMKYRHYAPRAQATAIGGPTGDVARVIRQLLGEDRDGAIGIVIFDETASAAGLDEGKRVCLLGSRRDLAEAGRRFYDCLRRLDQAGVDRIYVEESEPVGLGLALSDRLRRATGGRRIDAVIYPIGT